MKTKIGEEEALKLTQSMHTLTEEASLNEEQAAQCEREADKMMCAAFLSRNRSKELTATVTRFVKKGAFVALENSCEGLIPFKNMDDVYSVDDQNVFMIGKRTRRVIRLGDMVLVKCTQADIATGQIEFRLLEPKS
jgi:ribonuclease R